MLPWKPTHLNQAQVVQQHIKLSLQAVDNRLLL
jgi:hypothetical protein